MWGPGSAQRQRIGPATQRLENLACQHAFLRARGHGGAESAGVGGELYGGGGAGTSLSAAPLAASLTLAAGAMLAAAHRQVTKTESPA